MSALQDQIDAAVKAHETGDAQATQQLTAAKQALVDAKAADAIEDAAYEAKINDLQARLDALEQPAMMLGGNVGSLADRSQYPDPLNVTRVYYAGSDTDITSANDKVRAVALGSHPKQIMNSHAGSNAEYDALCKSRTAVPGIEEVMIRRHEPESKVAKKLYTIAQWQAEQRRASPIARNNGFKFGMILMSWTILKPTAARTFEIYMDPLDPELFDLPGVDYYPTNTLDIPIKDAVARIQDKFTKWQGDKPWVFGEFGVLCKGNPNQALDMVGQFKEALKDTNCVEVCYYSVNEWALTPQVSAAFYKQ